MGHAVTGRYTYRFNPRTSVYGEYTYLLRDFEPPSNDYDVHRPSLGISHSFSPTLSGSAGVGYYWENPDRGSTTGGVYYNVSLSQRAEKTTYTISFQGGYTEEYFTAENLGFTKYYSGIGTISHQLLEKVSVGLFSSYEWTKHSAGQIDRIWGVGGNASYQIWRFLLLSLDVSHRENHSKISDREYSERTIQILIRLITPNTAEYLESPPAFKPWKAHSAERIEHSVWSSLDFRI